MKTFVAIIALSAVLLIGVHTAFASEDQFQGRVTDENPYVLLPEVK